MLRAPNTLLVTALGCNEGHCFLSSDIWRYFCNDHYIKPIHFSKKVVLTNHYFAVEKYHHSEKFSKQLLSKHG